MHTIKLSALSIMALALMFAVSGAVSRVYATSPCNISTQTPSADWHVGAQTCQFPNTSVDGVVNACPTNTAVLYVDATTNLSIATGQKIAVGSLDVSAAGGSLVINPGGELDLNSAIYMTDADGDHYASYGTNWATTGTVCRTTATSLSSFDCGDGNANAYPGAATYQSGTFTNTQNGALTHDWNCNGTESHFYADGVTSTAYTCDACTYGAYTSRLNLRSGFSATVACGAAGTYNTVTSTACQATGATLTNCTAVDTTSSKTQTCL